MICNHCIYEPMCWRLTIGMKPKNECRDFKGKDEASVFISNSSVGATLRPAVLPQNGRDNR